MTTGNAAWLLTSATLIFVMIPGVALFYSGRVRVRAALNMMMLTIASLCVTAVVWTFWGWSIAFAGKDIAGIIADPASGFLLRDAIVADKGVFTASVTANTLPSSVNIPFQMAIAMLTVAFISGALAERVKYGTWLLFVALWVTLDYTPLAHMLWGGGILSPNGAVAQAIGVSPHDFAGGSLISLNAAVTALAISLIIGKRKVKTSSVAHAHNIPHALLGALLLWFGWFGLNAGAALAANGTAGYVWITTALAGATGMLAWGFIERLITGHFTPIGAASGLIAGLVAITAGANVVAPLWAMIIGLAAGAVSCIICYYRQIMPIDDALNVVGVQGAGSLIGILFTGLFAEGVGLFTSGQWRQLAAQLALIVVTVLYSGVVSALLAFALEKTIGWRVSERHEIEGIDASEHGVVAEQAVDLLGTPLEQLSQTEQSAQPTALSAAMLAQSTHTTSTIAQGMRSEQETLNAQELSTNLATSFDALQAVTVSSSADGDSADAEVTDNADMTKFAPEHSVEISAEEISETSAEVETENAETAESIEAENSDDTTAAEEDVTEEDAIDDGNRNDAPNEERDANDADSGDAGSSNADSSDAVNAD